jgi:uncharacterized RDD family membrane protein YckC
MAAWEPRSFADQLNIDTPEQVELHFSVAGIGSRFIAVLLDHLIVLAALILEVLILVWIGASAPRSAATAVTDTAAKWAAAILIFLNACIIWGYFALFEAFWRGQTPGKRVMKLRVIKDSGRQITLFEALTRNLIRFIDYLPGLYLVGVITMLCNKRHQRLGDLAAGTIVIHERTEEQPLLTGSGTGLFPQPQPLPYEPLRTHVPPSNAGFPADAIARLGPEDLAVIEAFFARALDLPLETRAQIAHRIAAQMATKMGVPAPEGNPERMLEAIAYAMRGTARLRTG